MGSFSGGVSTWLPPSGVFFITSYHPDLSICLKRAHTCPTTGIYPKHPSKNTLYSLATLCWYRIGTSGCRKSGMRQREKIGWQTDISHNFRPKLPSYMLNTYTSRLGCAVSASGPFYFIHTPANPSLDPPVPCTQNDPSITPLAPLPHGIAQLVCA